MEPTDQVNSPAHYKRGIDPLLADVRFSVLEGHDGLSENLECIEAMVSMFDTIDQLRGYLRGNSFKYRWRYRDKGRVQSLEKAQWYEDKLIALEKTVEAHHD